MFIYIARITWDMCAGRAPRSLSYMAHINISFPLLQIGYYMAVIISSSGLPFHRIVATKTYLGSYTDYLTNVALAPHPSIDTYLNISIPYTSIRISPHADEDLSGCKVGRGLNPELTSRTREA